MSGITERVDGIEAQARTQLRRRGVPIPGWRATPEEMERFRAAVARVLVDLGQPAAVVPQLAETIAGRLAGLGLLQSVMEEPGVEEVIVRNGHLLVEREGRIEVRGRPADDAYFLSLARRAADLGGRAMWGNRPFVLVDSPDGSRFTAMTPPLSVAGTAINVRVHRREPLTLGDLARMGAFEDGAVEAGEEDGEGGDVIAEELRAEGVDAPTPPVLKFLAAAVRENRASIVISGPFSAGKTTLLSALIRLIPPERVLAVAETFLELKVAHPYPARVVVPEVLEEQAGLPPMREVVNVLYTRMRPDVIVFGEVVGDEAVPLLDAMGLGVRVLTTVHGDDAYGALLRLEVLAMASGLPLPAVRERVARGVDLIVHLARNGRRRYVAEVALVEGYDHEAGRYRLSTLYRAGERRTADRTARLRRIWEQNR